jgi:hypothetical protein
MGNTNVPHRSYSFDSATLEAKKRSDSKSSPTFANYDARRISPGNGKRKRFESSESIVSVDWGWFEDQESPSLQHSAIGDDFAHQPLQRALTLPAPATEPPMYVLESSLETQQLWYSTAGRRPQQPEQERKYFENLWKQNFDASEIPSEETKQAPQKNSNNSIRVKTESRADVLFRGKSPFSNSVSKSFSSAQVSSMTIQLPYYRIIHDAGGAVHAEYLIVVSLGGRSAVTFGVWKRHSDFSTLAKNIHNDLTSTFKNSLLSWQCVLERKRWFKSLDTDYLAVKCFLIERFLIDLLFEAPTPDLISEFLGLMQ